ncbi:putative F-box/LRR-repeat protein At3g49150 [Gossypium raimondii]|uniref:F-box domain-containing protein n=1 Tax=Gossypium raimondii TaxID=29730 RepID=A0A0D2R7C2_GOSRA|nr:putative F-box/LRR-repeat protein At3g49150 [Gossypium raimondii]KJB27794.1 hypothetical protein B456_005G010300 [Gossypium raimondii]
MAMCVEDRISSFPDYILCHILSFLPIKEAVRTSIISTKWRCLFSYISTIEFDHCLLSGLTDRNVDSFKNFVDRLLKFPDQVSLDCFRLSDGISSWNDEDHDFDVSGWICAALCRGVKEIDLQLDNLGDAPPVLFTCHSLVKLTLEGKGSKLEVPPDACLGNLKTLWLENWVLFGDSINRLISNCHVLEDLAFTDCCIANTSELTIQSPSLKELVLDFFSEGVGDFNYVLVINAPNLVYFRYYSKIVDGYTLSNMNSLENADIHIDAFDFEDDETTATRLFSDDEINATRLIQGICNVRSLTLVIDGVIPPAVPFPIFHNLIEFNFYGRGIWLVEFLYCAPNLKTLKFSFSDVPGTRWKTLLTEVPSCLLFHLKEIEMLISCSDKHMIRYFLDNAMVLEKLIIRVRDLTATQREKARNKLLQLLKNSKKCQFVIL